MNELDLPLAPVLLLRHHGARGVPGACLHQSVRRCPDDSRTVASGRLVPRSGRAGSPSILGWHPMGCASGLAVLWILLFLLRVLSRSVPPPVVLLGLIGAPAAMIVLLRSIRSTWLAGGSRQLGAFSALRGVCLCGLVDQVLFSGQGRGMSRWARMIRWVGVSRSRTGPVAV